MRLKIFICLLLAGVTLAIYWPVRHYGIIYYDDPMFTTDNDMIRSGVNWHSLWWAFSSVVLANWHPVTNVSFVLDRQLFGANPGAEHLVNVAFHAANAVLLFLVLNRMVPSPWRSAMVAALFAWHPLRVESVAWISERKDVLSVFFFFLTLLAYARYAQGGKTSNIQHPTSNAQWYYWLAVFFFALGLMSKPMLVTVPFVLLLLDYWPLRRVTSGKWQVVAGNPAHKSPATLNQLVFEKWPFFALSAVFSGLTYWAQKNSAGVVPWANIGPGDRLGNAATSYLQYLGKLFWPEDLAVIYPYPKSQDELAVWLTALCLLAISILCVSQLQRRPYLAVGWFWYLGTLIPVIGLVQAGEQALADRYTYIPLIGPVISLVWLIADCFQSRKILLSAAVVIVLVACVNRTSRQLQFWHDTVDLAGHNVAVTPANATAYFILGLGLEHTGETNRALACYRIAAALSPEDMKARNNLAVLLRQQGHLREAEAEYSAMLALKPDDGRIHLCLAEIVGQLGRPNEAVFHLNEALRLEPDSTDAMNNLAWTLATCRETNLRDGTRAVQLAERACELTHYRKTIYLGTLAAAYAEAGRYEEAVATAQKACALASESGQPELLKRNQELLELYRQHQPYHEPVEKPVPAAP